MMAPPSREIIDLTVDDDDDKRPPRQRPPPLSPSKAGRLLAPGDRPRDDLASCENLVAQGVPVTHGHPHAPSRSAPPRSAQGHRHYSPIVPIPPSPPLAPAAKRQKLSGPPSDALTHEQLMTKSVGLHLSSYAKAAVAPFRNKGLDEDKLKAEVMQSPEDTCHRSTLLDDGSDHPVANRSNWPWQESTKMRFDGIQSYPTTWFELSLSVREP